MAKLLKLSLIETEELRGNGKEESPYRRVKQLFTEDGILVLEYDVHTDKTTMTANLLEHLGWISTSIK